MRDAALGKILHCARPHLEKRFQEPKWPPMHFPSTSRVLRTSLAPRWPHYIEGRKFSKFLRPTKEFINITAGRVGESALP